MREIDDSGTHNQKTVAKIKENNLARRGLFPGLFCFSAKGGQLASSQQQEGIMNPNRKA
jgi:hypothetical protein